MTDAPNHEPSDDAARLEALWSGEFGDAYLERNKRAGDGRGAFWGQLLAEIAPRRILEVGCNVGANLRWVTQLLPDSEAHGVDVNVRALLELHSEVPSAGAAIARARQLPFRDGEYDFVFTMGVLIHQPPSSLNQVMAEIVRLSSRWILCGEYAADRPQAVPYRGLTGALFKRDFGAYYLELFPGLTLERQGFLSKAEGWDDVTWWLLRA